MKEKNTKLLRNLLTLTIIILGSISFAFNQVNATTTSSGDLASTITTSSSISTSTITSVISLSNNSITVDGSTISEDTSSGIYLTYNIETNADLSSNLSNVTNKVINITKGGTYVFSGEITDAQIAVDVSDSETVNIILNGVSITCRTAPAIVIYNAYDSETAGEAGVNFYLADGTSNTVAGVHIPKSATYTVNGESKSYSKKYDGAISSEVSISFNGTGTLNISSDKEGIETKRNLTINDNGTYNIVGQDDCINASKDNESIITINGGIINCSVSSTASEGDAIDSNGSIIINGGTLNVYASATSPDSGLDSDLGTTINGGTIISTGNMYDEVKDSSTQNFIYLTFANQLSAGSKITIKDSSDNIIVEYTTDRTVTSFLYSSSLLSDGSYSVYVNDTLQWNGTTTSFAINSSSHTFSNVTDNGNTVNINNNRGGMLGQNNSSTTASTSNSTNKIMGIAFLGLGVVLVGIIATSLLKTKKKNEK